MKTKWTTTGYLLFAQLLVFAQEEPSRTQPQLRLENREGGTRALPALQSTAPTWQVTARDRDSQVWEGVSTVTVPGRGVRARAHRFVELATGLNYRDADGNWHSTREEFELSPDGRAVARFGPHQLIVGNNINSATAIDFLGEDGSRFQSGPLAVGYYDALLGKNIILGTIRDTAGVITGP